MINILITLLMFSFSLAPIFILMIYFLPDKHSNIRAWMPVFASGTILVSLLLLLPYSLQGYIFESTPLRFIAEIDLYFRIDLLGIYFGLVSTIIWLLASVYSIGYMKNEHSTVRYYCFFTICLYFVLGLSFSGNLFTFFIFYELVTLNAYPLIIQEETESARLAGRKYLFYALTGDAFVLFTVFMAYKITGTLNFSNQNAQYVFNIQQLNILIATTMLGFGVKAAIMPLHGWIPDAHPAAPSPASALLSGVLVNAGILGMIRVFYNVLGVEALKAIDFNQFLVPIILFTIITASIVAINQDDLKRRLAYSTIGQLSYIILGVVLYNKNGLIGAILHIANHAFMKATLFLCAGIIIKETGIRKISEMNGIGKRLPVTMAIFSIASLGMIGTPPMCGFISKWLLSNGALDAGQPMYVVTLLISSLLGAVYFLPITYKAFFQQPENDKWKNIQYKWKDECNIYMMLSIITGAILIIVFGIFVDFTGSPFNIATKIAEMWV